MRRELEVLFADTYRRIWIYTTRLGTVQLVLFPVSIHQNYRIVTEKNFGEITIEKLKDLIMRNP
jgi:hypothetical protein